MYVHICLCVYVYVYVYLYMYTRIFILVYIYIHCCIYTRTPVVREGVLSNLALFAESASAASRGSPATEYANVFVCEGGVVAKWGVGGTCSQILF